MAFLDKLMVNISRFISHLKWDLPKIRLAEEETDERYDILQIFFRAGIFMENITKSSSEQI